MAESFIPYLEAVIPTYPQDLNPKGFFSLSHSYVVPFLFGLLPSLLYSILGLFDLLQFLLQGNDLLFGGSQLILDIAKKHPLAFSLPLSAVQGSCNTFPFPLLLNQLALELLNTLFGHVEGIYGRYSSPLFCNCTFLPF